jgi:hypothetical protein
VAPLSDLQVFKIDFVADAKEEDRADVVHAKTVQRKRYLVKISDAWRVFYFKGKLRPDYS